jgi:hypothetical protein
MDVAFKRGYWRDRYMAASVHEDELMREVKSSANSQAGS